MHILLDMNPSDAKLFFDSECVFAKDRKINTKKINKIFEKHDFSSLEGNSSIEKIYLLYHKKTGCEACRLCFKNFKNK